MIAGLRAGTPEAFDAAYAAHKDIVYRFLFGLCRQKALAEDLFQETWLRLARHAPGLRPDTNLRAWLCTVARNLYRSHARWALLDVRALAALERWWYLEAAPAPEDRLTAAGTLARLATAFADLPPAFREVLLLAVGEGLPQEQVARVLGISHDAVRQRLARARGALASRVSLEDGRWNGTISSTV